MVPREPRDKEQIGGIGEAGLFLVSDRTTPLNWESHPRWPPKPARERLGPLKSDKTRTKKWPRTEAEE
jgi:hypothetical protein